MLVGVGALAPGQIPDFKTAAATDERDLALQLQSLAKIIGQEETALLVGGTVLRLGVELAQVSPNVTRGKALDFFRGGADPLEFVRRHDEQKLTARFRDHEELIDRAVAPPAGGDRDAILIVNLMTKFAGIEI